MRQTIIDDITTALQKIKKADGFQTDSYKIVTDWKCYADPSTVDCIQIRDNTCNPIEDIETADNARALITKALNVEIDILQSGKTAAATLRVIMADVYKALGTIAWSDNVVNCKWLGDSLIVTEENKVYAGCAINIQVIYQTPEWTD